jgi:Predicted metal binding domain
MHEAVSRALFEEQVIGLTPRLARLRDWIIHKVEYPLIDCEFCSAARSPLRLRLLCDDWNSTPPSIELLSSGGEFLTSAQIPNGSTGIFHRGPHPSTGRPFVCMQGSREYHTHPNHVSDRWDGLRWKDMFRLSEIVTQIWHGWQKDAK